MQAISFLAATAYLLDDAPDWTEIALDAELPNFLEQGVTQIETRTPLGDTPRLSLGFTTFLQGDAVTDFRNALQALTTERVLCPLWPAGFEAGVTPTVTADYYVLIEDGFAVEIKAANQQPFHCRAYPLLVGKFDEPPDPSLLSGLDATVQIKFVECDSLHVTFPIPSEVLAGPLTAIRDDDDGAISDDDRGATIFGDDPAGLNSAPLFPFRANWDVKPKGARADVTVERRQIGETRSDATQFFDQPSRRAVQQGFTLNDTDTWNLLAWFVAVRGTQQSFWLPAGVAEAVLEDDAHTGDTTLSVDDEARLGDNQFALLDDGVNRAAVQVSSVEYKVWNLAAPLATDFSQDFTRVESLLLARFSNPKITIKFAGPNVANAKLSFLEVAAEIETPAGETPGTTLGAVALSAYLYHFQIQFPDITQHFRITDFERDLTATGTTDQYTSEPIEHSDITEAATLERQDLELTSRHFAGNPLSLMLPFQLEFPLLLDIYEVDVQLSYQETAAADVASTGNLNTGVIGIVRATPAFTVDGVGIYTASTRVLLKNETDPTKNGLYTLSDLGDSAGLAQYQFVRTGDSMDGAVVTVAGGTANAGKSFSQTTASPIVGTSNLVFTQVSVGDLAVNLRRVFSGEVLDAEYEPPFVKARASSMRTLLDRKIPRLLVQTGCNWALFETRCGLLKADWKWTGLVTSYDAATLTLVLNTVARVSGSAVTLDANFFAGGIAMIGAGTSLQSRLISGSAAASGGNLTLSIGMPFTTNPIAGATVTFHPGCAGRYQEDCIAKFNNGARFGGFPFLPMGDPSKVRVDNSVSSGGKK